MQASARNWFLVAGILWVSAATTLTLGFVMNSLSVLRWAGAVDAAAALVLTAVAFQKLNR